MLKPLLNVDFGRIPVYFLMLTAAFFAGLIALNVSMKKRGFSIFSRKQMRGSYYISVLCGIVCANAATWLLFDDIDRSSLYHMVTEGGFSFWFGLLGFLLSLAVNALIRRYPVRSVLNMFVPSLTLIHFFARLGCMLRGCCYGRTVSVLGVEILFPARELECLFALILFIFTVSSARVIFFRRLPIYLFSYSIVRFVLEFFRDDYRGSLFGIDILSPAQIVSLVVFVLIALNWLILLILKLTRADAAARKAFGDIANKIFRKGKPRVLRPFDTNEPLKKRTALKIILWILPFLFVIFALLVYFNPFNLPAFDSLRYEVEDMISGLFSEPGADEEIGRMNGGELFCLENKPRVANGGEALNLVMESGYWSSAEFENVEVKQLPNGKTAYVLRQMVNGKPVLGSDCVLIVDQDGCADYIIGDDASTSSVSEIAAPSLTTAVTMKDAFGDKVEVLDQSLCYYDSGNGLIEAQHLILAEKGSLVPTVGAVVRADNGAILCLTPATKETIATESRLKITLVTQLMIDALKDAEAGKTVSVKNSALLESADKGQLRLAESLEKAYSASGMSPSEFSTLLCSVNDSIASVNDITVQKFGDIVAREVKDAQLTSGNSEKTAGSRASKVDRAFTGNGFKDIDDENTMHLTTGDRKTSFGYRINYKGDEDVCTLDMNENHALSITLKTDGPIVVEVSNERGDAVLTAYVEDEEHIELFREDGMGYTLRVKDASLDGGLDQKAFGYKLSVEGISAPDVPKDIADLLNTVEDSYNRSNLTTFASILMEDGQILGIEEAIALGAVGAISDSCISSCGGMGDGVDSSKTAIATVIVPYADSYSELGYLKGTEMELEYFDHKTEGDVAYICASIRIAMDGMSIYDGYCYLQAEYITADELSEQSTSSGNETVDGLLSLASGDKYYLTSSNTDTLYSVFGVTGGIPDSRSDLQSLYDLWEQRSTVVTSSEHPEYSVEVTYMYIDRAKALADGHSEDKVDGFEEYTARQNLMQAKMQRMILVYQRDTYIAIAELTGPITDIIGLITNPVGGFMDILMSQDEETDDFWTIAKIIANPADGIEDAVTGAITDALVDEAKDLAVQCDILISAWDEAVAMHTATLQSCLDAGIGGGSYLPFDRRRRYPAVIRA